MKLKKIIAAAAAFALTAVVGFAAAPANAAPKTNRYGGPVYGGNPQLNITISFVQAGGGPAHFSTAKVLPALVGEKLAKQELAKLTKQYGQKRIATFVKVGDFVVEDAVRIATKAGVKFPKANLKGKALASQLVKVGVASDNTFWSGLQFDKLLGHKMHDQIMNDIDKKFGGQADADYHKISNQLFYDAAHALGNTHVKLARFH